MPLNETGSTWLPLADCLTWLKVTPGTTQADQVELARRAAGECVEDFRRDLAGTPGEEEEPAFGATPRIVQAGIMLTARLYTRQGSPTGLVEFGDFAAGVLRSDPDVRSLLGRPQPTVT